ncbi:MAG: hypothetical protein KAH33_06990, partial [Candidatus Delongbacteria bacterium]|nr:hypothetical protein [Candidatus Delongbacteria bacterium]
MKNILVLLILIFSFVLSAKIVKVEGEYTYTYSDDETIVQAKKKCLDFAKRDALEKFATYISSESVYKNYMTEKDQVVARSLGVLKNVVINKENIDRANSTIFYKVSAEVDEEEVLKKLEKKQEKNTLNVKIKDFVSSGMNAEKQLRIGDAIKYYYWSLLLVKSDPKSGSLKFKEFDDRLLTIALPEKINHMMNSLEFKIKEVSESKKYKNIDFEMKYKGSSVQNLVLTYFNGDVWSQPVKVRNGVGNIELFGDAAESITKLSLKTDHMYEEQCNYDHNVKQALKKVSHIPFSSAKFKVKIPKARKDVVEKPIVKKPIVKKVEPIVEKPVEKKVEKPVIVEKKAPMKKEENMMEQHYSKPKKKAFVDPSIRRKEAMFYGIFAGANGDFGDNEILGESGFASSGFGIGFSTDFPVGQSGFYFTTDFSFIYHAVDEGMYEEWNDDYYYNYELGEWFNIPMMIGASYKHIV